jgi:hypothetical protein
MDLVFVPPPKTKGKRTGGPAPATTTPSAPPASRHAAATP